MLGHALNYHKAAAARAKPPPAAPPKSQPERQFKPASNGFAQSRSTSTFFRSDSSSTTLQPSTAASLNRPAVPAVSDQPSRRQQKTLARSNSHLADALYEDDFGEELSSSMVMAALNTDSIAPKTKFNKNNNNASTFNSKGSVVARSPARPETTGSNVYFDENDFSSDIELEIAAASTVNVAYPSLPGFSKPSDSGRVEYPALPKGSQGKADLPPNQAPNSSLPFSWGSSPPEHHAAPPGAWPRDTQRIITESRLEPRNPPPAPQHVAQPRPAKRRKLPWADEPMNDEGYLNKHQKFDDKKFGTKPSFASDVQSYAYQKPRVAAKSEQARPVPQPYTRPEPVKPAPSRVPARAVVKQQSLEKRNQKELDFTKPAAKLAQKNILADLQSGPGKNGPKPRVPRVFLSDEQEHVRSLVVERQKSIFFTGSAGTGKSVLLREIITALRRKFAKDSDRVAVTASTGLAACNIGGVTLHSFAGIGLGKETVEELVKKIRRNQKARQRWLRTKVLIMDEVSMVDGDLFDKLEAIARTIRSNGRPFGGIQLVMTGDFFQLPPVPEGGRQVKFAFDAGAWNTSIDYTIKLSKVFRQKDPEFANMLNEMREGNLSAATIASFSKLNRELKDIPEGQQATELFPTRNEVDRANAMRMHALPGQSHIFEARDGGSVSDRVRRDRILANCMAPPLLQLKVGSQVMLIKNMDESLVNGSIGTIVDFMSEATYSRAYEAEAAGGADDEHDPNEDADAQALRRSDKDSIAKIRARLESHATSTAQVYPLVHFTLADRTTRTILLHRETWKVELPNGEVEASRAQVPLILAWALSIHKAQGQTLEFVKVDLGKVFERGQAYVALSRATSMAGLQVTRFDARRVTVHDRVRQFYVGLSNAEQVSKQDNELNGANKRKKPKPTKGGKRQSSVQMWDEQYGGDIGDDSMLNATG